MLSTGGTELVEAYSEDVSRLVRRCMLDAIPDGEPHRWLYRVARDYPSRPGKALRPALCVATSRAFGGSDADVVPVAVAIELLHNAFLVHDDGLWQSFKVTFDLTGAPRFPMVRLSVAVATVLLPGSLVGGRLAHRFDGPDVRRVFGWFLVAFGVLFTAYRLAVLR